MMMRKSRVAMKKLSPKVMKKKRKIGPKKRLQRKRDALKILGPFWPPLTQIFLNTVIIPSKSGATRPGLLRANSVAKTSVLLSSPPSSKLSTFWQTEVDCWKEPGPRGPITEFWALKQHQLTNQRYFYFAVFRGGENFNYYFLVRTSQNLMTCVMRSSTMMTFIINFCESSLNTNLKEWMILFSLEGNSFHLIIQCIQTNVSNLLDNGLPCRNTGAKWREKLTREPRREEK